ncbi:hypothetical protein HUJ05_009492 [Dendroctonus ponderosae]|nr:hypothetical protein HUJ05_009491 [Dendroctonus ponderosae]KAH1001355.1 hypothetical protein HUJ05_009492 [Dendroctonus ponderosae]
MKKEPLQGSYPRASVKGLWPSKMSQDGDIGPFFIKGPLQGSSPLGPATRDYRNVSTSRFMFQPVATFRAYRRCSKSACGRGDGAFSKRAVSLHIGRNTLLIRYQVALHEKYQMTMFFLMSAAQYKLIQSGWPKIITGADDIDVVDNTIL